MSSFAQQMVESMKCIASSSDTSFGEANSAGEVAKQGAVIIEETIEGIRQLRAGSMLAWSRSRSSAVPASKLAKSCKPSTPSPTRPICWRSTRRLKRRVPANTGVASRWSLMKSENWRQRSAVQSNRFTALITGIQQGIADAISTITQGAKEADRGVKKADQAGKALRIFYTPPIRCATRLRQFHRYASNWRKTPMTC